MSVECPACGRRLRAQESLVGRRVKCPVCGNKFVIEHLSFGISQPSAAPSQVRGAASDRISRSERLVCSAKSSILPSLKISPDRKRTAYVAVERIGRFTANRLVIVDGIPGEPYEGIAVGSPIFSPDGKRLVYVAQTGSKWTIVLDGRQASSCDGVMKGEMLFSPNSARLGYIALSGKIFGFSPKARDYLRESHVWWGNVLRAKWYVTVDETRGDHYPLVTELRFSPDSRHVFYLAKKGRRSYVAVVDGKESNPYDGLAESASCISNDGRRFAFFARSGSKEIVVVDGRETHLGDCLVATPPVFSPDSMHLAYFIAKGNKQCHVMDGTIGKEYDGFWYAAGKTVHIFKPVFSPDSKRLAYAARRGDRWCIVVNGEEGKSYDAIAGTGPVFSPDSKRLAYGAHLGTRKLIVVDGVEEGTYSEIMEGTPVFSPDSQRVAYAARIDNKWVVVTDGESDGPYDAVECLAFSEDGRHIAYSVRQGQHQFVVLDRKPRDNYDAIVTTSEDTIAWKGNTLSYLARRGDSIYLTHETPG